MLKKDVNFKLAREKNKKHKLRHKIFYSLLRPLVIVFLKIKFRYKYKKAKNLPKNYLVISNHTTDYDPLFVSSSFKKQMYFVASEHLARWKTAFKFLDFAFEPIIRYKATPAVSTIMKMLKKLNEGSNVCIFAEGIRSWNGETCKISLSTAKLIKSAKCGLVTYKISGGYLASPIWSESGLRKGKISGTPIGIYTAEQLEKMTNEEILDIIEKDIYENAFETNKLAKIKYKSKKLAEGIENIAFVCPFCKARNSLNAQNQTISCSNCNKTFKYNEYGNFEGTSFKNMLELYNWQTNEIEKDVIENQPYSNDNVVLSSLKTDHSRTKLAEGTLTLNKDYLTCKDFKIKTSEISEMAPFGKRGIVFSSGKDYYELFSTDKFRIMKFIIYFNIYKKI